MQELSLNVLDIAQNSVSAGATLITISVFINRGEDALSISIEDNGCGMSGEVCQKVCDPFYTTRTTRKVGMGLPFFKMAAEQTGGSFTLSSAPGEGTQVKAVFVFSSIDRAPLGDMASTVSSLVQCSPDIDFIYTLCDEEERFTFDTREVRAVLGGVPLDSPDVSLFIKDYVSEHSTSIQNRSLQL